MSTVQFQLGGTLKFVTEPEGYALITITYDRFTITAKGQDMAYTLPNDHLVQVQVAYVDSHGNPANIDGAVTWDTSDANIATVDVDANDSTRATVTPNGQVGQVQVSCSADADLGEGTRELVTTMDIEIVAGEAVAGTISPVGAPQPM